MALRQTLLWPQTLPNLSPPDCTIRPMALRRTVPCPQTLDPHQHLPRNQANGFEADCDVIYGDTDSVMVNFGVRVYGGDGRDQGAWKGQRLFCPAFF